MADRKRVHWDEAVLSKPPGWCRTSSYDKPLLSPYPLTDDVTNVYDDSTDTEDTLTDTDDAFILENDTPSRTDDTLIDNDGALTDSDDTLNYMDDARTDMDRALVTSNHTPFKPDDILIDEEGTLTDSKDDLTDTDDTLIARDGALTDTNETLPKTDYGSPTMKFILSIDGGGIRGYSTLTILQALMDEIDEIERADKPTSSVCSSSPGPPNDELRAVPNPASAPMCERLPFHYLDYIGGTGSGNVIAMMPAEEKMSVVEVMDAYRDMCAPGGKRRLVNKKVVCSKRKRDKASSWLHDHAMLARASPNNKYQESSANPARNADLPYNNNNNNNPSHTILESAHFRLLDESPSANQSIYLLSIGSAITDRSADPSPPHRPSTQIHPVHQDPSLHTHPLNKRAGPIVQPETLRPARRY